jgi:hypothetical protein
MFRWVVSLDVVDWALAAGAAVYLLALLLKRI